MPNWTDTKPARVLGLGTIVVDHHVVLERFPDADAKGEVIEDRYQVGGPVPTALALLRRFHHEATFLGHWADDAFGDLIERDLREHGIKACRSNAPAGARSGFAHVWVEQTSGRRTIAAYRGSHPIGVDALERIRFADFDALHLDGWSGEAARVAAAEIRRQGGLVSMDLGSPKADWRELVAATDLLNCPARLLEALFGNGDIAEGALRLMELGPRQVSVTDGENGASLATADGVIHRPALVVEAVDTNGAGDTFAGAMLHAALRGWEPNERLEFAVAAAGLKCARAGNREALPTLHQIAAILPKRDPSGRAATEAVRRD